MKRCMKDGGQLALIDTVKKIKYVRSQMKTLGRVHVGIIRVDGGTTWVGISTGELNFSTILEHAKAGNVIEAFFCDTGLTVASSLPWHGGHADAGDRNCVNIESSSNDGLCTYSCSQVLSYYVCEVPILNANTMPTN